jgi:hypothetical protein
VDLSNNSFSGQLSERWQSGTLQSLDLSHNGITLPSSAALLLGSQSQLQYLDLSYNPLNGPLAALLEGLTGSQCSNADKNSGVARLGSLRLSHCGLYGPLLSASLAALFAVQVLDLSKNNVTGSLPSLDGGCKYLDPLYGPQTYYPDVYSWESVRHRIISSLWQRPFAMVISSQKIMVLLASMWQVDISGNPSLSGVIPDQWTDVLPHLLWLDLSRTSLRANLMSDRCVFRSWPKPTSTTLPRRTVVPFMVSYAALQAAPPPIGVRCAVYIRGGHAF